jgi:hypothetical protein
MERFFLSTIDNIRATKKAGKVHTSDVNALAALYGMLLYVIVSANALF